VDDIGAGLPIRCNCATFRSWFALGCGFIFVLAAEVGGAIVSFPPPAKKPTTTFASVIKIKMANAILTHRGSLVSILGHRLFRVAAASILYLNFHGSLAIGLM
jgi:hypothetical protein